MKLNMEFAYLIEISKPSVRWPGERLRPVAHWLFGRETIEIREVGPDEVPVAVRGRWISGREYIHRTDGEQMLNEMGDVDILKHWWPIAYLPDDCPRVLRSGGRWLARKYWWRPTYEGDFPKPSEGALVWSDRENVRERCDRSQRIVWC
jgi:hypothetical protein